MAGAIQNIKTKVGQTILEKLSNQTNHHGNIINFKDLRNVGLIFNATQSINFEVIRHFVKKLNKEKKDVKIIGYVHSKKIIDHYLYRKGFDFFTQKDLNWYFKPKPASIQSFVNEPFDVLINLSLEDYLPVQFVTVQSKAKFKISRLFPHHNYADMFIDINKNKDEFQKIRQEISKEHKMIENDLEHEIDEKTLSEIQLNFLIEQVLHYLNMIQAR